MRNAVSRVLQEDQSIEFAVRAAFLRANAEAYEWLVEKIKKVDLRKEKEAVLERVALAADFAANFHPGRFADGAIENLALEIGTELGAIVRDDGGFAFPTTRQDGRRRVLHVASEVFGIGGHTRMLCHWVRMDRSSCHSVVIVNQGDNPIPSWLPEAVQSNGGNLVVFQQGSHLCQKALWLREMARRSADLVVLHHIWYDVVPTVAFAVQDCPPVAVLNHADHLFWLGSSVTDIVINLRAVGSEHTAERRYVPRNTVIPIPLLNTCDKMSRRKARRALGIGVDQIMLLSVGRDIKYRPCGTYDFVATANNILDRHPGAHMYVVGESAAGIAPYLRSVVHDRLHFVGCVEDPSLYRAAADVYLESFPFGSQTALLEAALGGLPVVPAYAPLSPLLVANDDAVKDLLTNPKNEQEYVELVELLIRQPEQRAVLGEALKKRLLVDHVGEGWLGRLTNLYQETDRLSHCPRPIPRSACSTEETDIGLSLWHVMADGKTYSLGDSVDSVQAVLCHTAFLAKDIGDYAKARRFAWRAVRSDFHRLASWRLFMITLLGRAGKFIRLWLNSNLPTIQKFLLVK